MRPTFEIADGAWEVTSAGALRCRARVLAMGVMAYSDAELGSLAHATHELVRRRCSKPAVRRDCLAYL